MNCIRCKTRIVVEIAYFGLFSDGYGISDVWFVPKHYCEKCGVIEHQPHCKHHLVCGQATLMTVTNSLRQGNAAAIPRGGGFFRIERISTYFGDEKTVHFMLSGKPALELEITFGRATIHRDGHMRESFVVLDEDGEVNVRLPLDLIVNLDMWFRWVREERDRRELIESDGNLVPEDKR